MGQVEVIITPVWGKISDDSLVCGGKKAATNEASL